MVYSEIDFKKIEKQSKQRILNMFMEQNVKYETLVKENDDMNNKLFDIGQENIIVAIVMV